MRSSSRESEQESRAEDSFLFYFVLLLSLRFLFWGFHNNNKKRRKTVFKQEEWKRKFFSAPPPSRPGPATPWRPRAPRSLLSYLHAVTRAVFAGFSGKTAYLPAFLAQLGVFYFIGLLLIKIRPAELGQLLGHFAPPFFDIAVMAGLQNLGDASPVPRCGAGVLGMLK